MKLHKKKNKITLKDIHEDYLINNNESSPYFLSKEIFINICHVFFKELVKEILLGYVYEVPSKLGQIFIKRFKPSNKKPIDWKLTNEIYGEYNQTAPKGEKKFVYHKNNHSFGWSARWYWNKINYVFANKTFFNFVATRHNTRQVPIYIKEKNTIYKYEN